MERKTKKAFLFLLVIGTAFLISTIILSFNIKKEKKEIRKVKSELWQITKEKNTVKKNLQEMTRAKIDSELELDEQRRQTKVLEAKINSERKQKKLLTGKLEKKKEKIRELLIELEKKRQKENRLRELLNKTEQEKKRLTTELKKMKEKGVILEKIVIKPKEFSKKPKEFSGEVLIVNKEFNFLMLDIGKKKGIKPGTILGIYRNKKLLGKIKIEETYDNISQATILSTGLQEKEIIAGDKVQNF